MEKENKKMIMERRMKKWKEKINKKMKNKWKS